MGAGIIFFVLSGLLILSALAVLAARPVRWILIAGLSHGILFFVILWLLEVPIIALVFLVLMLFLLAGTLQLVRAYGARSFESRVSLRFIHVLGIFSSVLLGALVLLFLSQNPQAWPLQNPYDHSYDALALDSPNFILTGLAVLVFMFVFMTGLRWLFPRELKSGGPS